MIQIRALLMALLVLQARAVWAVDPPAAPATAAQIKIGPDAPTPRNEFGNSVAIDGDWAVIGDQVDDYGDAATGAAYVFRRTESGWVRVAKFSSGVQDDAFGFSVDISGSTIVVGAWADNQGGFRQGAAYVFERTRGTGQWTLAAKLTAADPFPGELFGDQFGFSVAIHQNTIAVGAVLADSTVDQNTGAVFVFNKGVDDQWHEVHKLWPVDATRGTRFGESVAVSTCRVLVGAPWTAGLRYQSGAAYVFDGCGDDAGWRQTARLTGESLDSFFGTAVALDRGIAVVGANANNEHGTFTGAAYVFGQHAGGPDRWGRLASLSAFDAKHDKNFGYSVGINDGTVIVGAPGDDHTGFSAGAAYVFRRNVGGRDHFGPIAKLTASDSDFGFEYFGWAVDISDSTILVGAPNAGAPFSGAAYLFPVPGRGPVCRVAGDARGDRVTLDFRLGPTLPVEWSVWAWIAGQPHLLWATPLGIIEPPVDLSVRLPGFRSLGRVWFLSILSTSENGIICADWDRVNTGRSADASAGGP